MNIKKTFTGAFLIIVVALFAIGFYIINADSIWYDEKINNRLENNRTNMPKLRDESSIAMEIPVNLVIFGVDEYEKRADVIMLLNYDPDSSKINLLSISRDTRVLNKGKYVKINSLIGVGGEKKIVDKIEELIGLPVDYYITLNFKGLRSIIDELGGVKVNVPFDMNYDDPTQDLHIHLKKGLQVLNGGKAEQYVRFRKGNNKNEGYGEGDIGRIKAQQDFIKSFIDQKLRLKYISKADDVFSILSKYMKTNIKINDIRYYLKDLKNIKADNISAFIMPGKPKYMNKQSFFIIDEKAAEKLIYENFSR